MKLEYNTHGFVFHQLGLIKEECFVDPGPLDEFLHVFETVEKIEEA